MHKGQQTKARLITTTADLIQRQGFGATGLSQILKGSQTPKGSLYFHFPGGKEELVLEALREATHRWRVALQQILVESKTSADVVQAACRILGERLERSNWEKGCPVATITLELAATNDTIRVICEEHFRLWEQFLHNIFLSHGTSPEDAAAWATFALSSIEGALLVSRAYQSTEPLHQTGKLLAQLLPEASSAEEMQR